MKEENNDYIFFDGTLLQGGAERVISILSHEMAENRNYNVEILLWYDEPVFYDIDPKVKLKIMPREIQSDNFFKKLVWLRKYFKQKRATVISFLAPFNMVAIICHMFVQTPIIVADRNDPRRVPDRLILRVARNILYHFASLVVVQTEHNYNYFKIIRSKKKCIIPNPVTLGEKNGLALRTSKKKKIVSVGRLMPQKNQALMIKAFAEALNVDEEYRLIIYGDGPLRDQLSNLANSLGIGDKVELPGNKKNIHESISDAEMFILSSNYEGMPNTLMEAMCLGLPVVSTKVSGATDIIQDGKNGLLVDVGDQEALTNAIRKLMIDKSLRYTMGQNASTLAYKYTSENITEMWVKNIINIK